MSLALAATRTNELVALKVGPDFALRLADVALIEEFHNAISEIGAVEGDDVSDSLYRLLEEVVERWMPEDVYWRIERERLAYLGDSLDDELADHARHMAERARRRAEFRS